MIAYDALRRGIDFEDISEGNHQDKGNMHTPRSPALVGRTA
jgi:hypothetical protein